LLETPDRGLDTEESPVEVVDEPAAIAVEEDGDE
jgi:hypothetical protein